MKKTVLITVTLAAMVCTAAWSQGSGRQGRNGPQNGGRMGGMMMVQCPAMAIMLPPAFLFERMAETLGLTDDQTSKLKTLATNSEQTLRTLAQKSSDASQALRKAVLASTYDAEKVKSLATAAERADAAIVDAYIDQWAQIRAILSAEQMTALQQIMSTQRRGPGGQNPGQPGPPPGADGMAPPPPPGADGMAPPPPPEE